MANKERAVMIRDPFGDDGLFPSYFLRDMDELWQDFMERGFFAPYRTPAVRMEKIYRGRGLPRADFADRGDSFEIKAELPGISKENVEITLDDDVIEIAAHRKDEVREEGENYFNREIGASSYKRSFALPEKVERDGVSATMENGVLILELPKKKPKKEQAKHKIHIS